jgi:hypothetical protein
MKLDKILTDKLVHTSTMKEVEGGDAGRQGRISQVAKRYAWVTSLYRLVVGELAGSEILFVPGCPVGLTGTSLNLKDREVMACKFNNQRGYFVFDEDFVIFVVPDSLRLGKGEMICCMPIIEVSYFL